MEATYAHQQVQSKKYVTPFRDNSKAGSMPYQWGFWNNGNRSFEHRASPATYIDPNEPISTRNGTETCI